MNIVVRYVKKIKTNKMLQLVNIFYKRVWLMNDIIYNVYW